MKHDTTGINYMNQNKRVLTPKDYGPQDWRDMLLGFWTLFQRHAWIITTILLILGLLR